MDRIEDQFHQHTFTLISRLGPVAQGWLLRRYFDWWHRNPDPWRLATDAEEREKHLKILNTVPDQRFRRVLDVGCSEGAFTGLAADRFAGAEITGIDLSARALRRARNQRRGNTRFFAMNLLEESPPGRFDLVFCSEMLYYLGTPTALRHGAERLRELLTPDGLLVVSHPWPRAEQLHAPLYADPELTPWTDQVDRAGSQTFAVAVFGRATARSRAPAAVREVDPAG